MPRRILCWDLDDTIGHFKRLSYTIHREPISKNDDEAKGTDGIRNGLKPVLQRLTKSGYIHALTTNVSTDYAKQVLQIAGLTEQFNTVFGKESIQDGGVGKTYQPVIEHYSLPTANERERLLVIGDAPNDEPCHQRGIVFIYQIQGAYYNAKVIELILAQLDTYDERFNKAFGIWHDDLPFQDKSKSNERIGIVGTR